MPDTNADTKDTNAQNQNIDQNTDQNKGGNADDQKADAKLSTALDGAGELPKAPATFPENWREEIAKIVGGTDQALVDKELKRLKMFNSPSDVYKSTRELEKKLSSGEFRAPLPKDATPEQIAAWRKSNGIPETPDGYKIELKDGMVVGEQDKPYVDMFTKAMHEKNATPDQLNAALDVYYDVVNQLSQQKIEAYENAKNETIKILQKEWGNDFEVNKKLIENTLNSKFGEAATHILNGFGSDDVPLMSNPEVVKAFAAIARELNPDATLSLPDGVSTNLQSVGTEIARLEKMMGDTTSEYWHGSNSQANQERYRQLISYRDNMSKKGG